jgi:hypothetical protein
MYYFLILFLTLFELQLFLIIKILRHYFPLRIPECPIQFRLCTFINCPNLFKYINYVGTYETDLHSDYSNSNPVV